MLELELEDQGPSALSCEQFLDNMKKNELKRASKYIELREGHDGIQVDGADKADKIRVQEMLEIEEQQQESQRILSKRALQIILRLEEFDWYETDIRGQ